MTVASTSRDRLLNLLLLLLLPRMGCLYLPLDPDLPVSQRRLLQLGSASLVVHSREELPAAPAQILADVSLAPQKTWLLLATSGTTGEPRLIELTGANLLASAVASNQHLMLAEDDKWLAVLPMHHIGGLAIALRCLYVGAGMVLLERFEEQAVLSRLAAGDITHLSLVPTMLYRLLKHDPTYHPPSSLRVVLLGGSSATCNLVQQALRNGWPVCPSYGLTEAASQVATFYPPPGQWNPGCVGEALPHMQLKLNRQGQIVLKGPGMAQTARSTKGIVSLLDEEGWLTTQDLGELDSAGRLVVLGRRDDLLISGGENVQPLLLEDELHACPGIGEVAVTAIPDPKWGEVLVVLYTGTIRQQEVESWAGAWLQGAYRPRYFFRLDELPRNQLGKLLRRELPERALTLVRLLRPQAR